MGLNDDLMHLAVNEMNIVFRPDVTSLGAILDGDVFNLELTGVFLKNGTPAPLSYEIRFFDLKKEMTRSSVSFTVKHDGAALPGAQITIDGQTVTTDSEGRALVRVDNNKIYSYLVTKPGFNPVTGSVSVGEGDVSTTVDATLFEGKRASAELTSLDYDEGVISATVEFGEMDSDCRVFLAVYDNDRPVRLSTSFSSTAARRADFTINKALESKDYTVKVLFLDGAQKSPPLSEPIIRVLSL